MVISIIFINTDIWDMQFSKHIKPFRPVIYSMNVVIQCTEFSVITVNTTAKTESPLENRVHLIKWNLTHMV